MLYWVRNKEFPVYIKRHQTCIVAERKISVNWQRVPWMEYTLKLNFPRKILAFRQSHWVFDSCSSGTGSKGKLPHVDREVASADQRLHYQYLHSTRRTSGRSVLHKQQRKNTGSSASRQNENTSLPRWTKHLQQQRSDGDREERKTWVRERQNNEPLKTKSSDLP